MKQTKATNEPPAGSVLAESKAETISLSAETIAAIADAVSEKLGQTLLPLAILHSRLCAANVLNSPHRASKVFRDAIQEAQAAKAEVETFYNSKEEV